MFFSQAFKADATNRYSQRVLQKLGFVTDLEILYKDYKSKDQEIIFKTEEPHNSFKIMSKCYDNE